ncbi:hypothetical protein EPUS_09493 [Endocarpon pusillum Z07020]|uniref:Integrase catalytic domain-containing protein n=1 Tax=Endocarpon pusillum (strain Z07020 / HMAS-L-300199) TaxID=1263415 RepID=U1GG30_ENDPU|nr:uncharacterized protein EPUS_09493 [Endocarpon pusillum Z07020]ERF70711.1 hypothetical protein EPUS_09493 [Endocarpon pusillum Z07020]
MTSSTSSMTTKVSITLTRPEDWDEWMLIVNSMARNGDVKDLINPDWPIEPPQLSEPKRPTAADIKPGAASLTELDTGEQKLFTLLREDYKYDMMRYRDRQSALSSIQDFILTRIDRQHLILLGGKETVYQMLTALKKRLAPTDRAREMDVIRRYRDLQRAPKYQQIDKWLLQWERVYTEAEQLSLPDVQKERPLYDFLNALRPVDTAFVAGREATVEERIRRGEDLPTVLDMLENYRNHVRISKAFSNKGSSYTAFATFQGSPEDKEKKKQKCPCGEEHLFKECPYLIESLRASSYGLQTQKSNRRSTRSWRRYQSKAAVEKAQKQAKEQKKSNKKEEKSTEKPATAMGAFAVESFSYKLKNCWTLDSGTDTHVCNNRTRFKFERMATEEDVLMAGKTTYAIEAFGRVEITVKTPRFSDESGVPATSVDDYWVLEYGPPEPLDDSRAAFALNKPSRAPKAPVKATATEWHRILAYARPESIAYLEQSVEGAKVIGRAPFTTDYETCLLTKAHELVSRRTDEEEPPIEPLSRIGERTLRKAYAEVTKKYKITIERSAPYTAAQNGNTERAGGVLILRARALRIEAKLPDELWPEAFKTAGYLNNRTPKRGLRWKTPLEAILKKRLQLSHLYPYGCRAYPLRKNILHSYKLEPRALIRNAAEKKISELAKKGTYEVILKDKISELAKKGTYEVILKDMQKEILPLTWVFKYKFNTDGYLEKFKARLAFEAALLKRFEMKSLGELKWFLADSKGAPKTPLPADGVPLANNDEDSDPQRTHAFQSRIGSLNFAAVVTRPDIAFTTSKLAQNWKNPSAAHIAVANRVIAYLYATRNYAIEYDGRATAQIFMASSDAAYADNESRHSSDGYLFQLYGGAIDWRAAKQRTVTTSSTEAELLALSRAAKEIIWWRRFFASIRFDTQQEMVINCDNLQTIRHPAYLNSEVRITMARN